MKNYYKVFQLIFAGLLILGGCKKQEVRTHVVFAPAENTNPTVETLRLTQEILQKRLDTVILGEAEIRVDGNNLQVDLSNEEDLPLAIELATKTGAVDFFHSETAVSIGIPIPPKSLIIITNADIYEAEPRFDSNSQSWFVDINLTKEGAVKFTDYTQNHIGDYLVIARENLVISSPFIQDAITDGKATIIGNFDKQTAEILAAQLNSGRLPLQLVVSK